LFFDYSHDLYTEVPFILISLAAIYSLLCSETDERRRLLFTGLAGLFAAAAFLTRTMGVTLMAAIVIYFAIRKRWAELGVALIVFILIWLPWLLRDLRVPHINGYREQLLTRNMYDVSSGYITFGDLVKRVLDNLNTYVLGTYPLIVLPILEHVSKWILALIGIIMTALTLTGFGARIRERGIGLLELYLLLSIGLLLLWPNVWAGDRFLLPILPILIWFLFTGMRWLGSKLHFNELALIVTALVVALFGAVDAQRAQATVRNMGEYARGDKFAGYDEGWRTYFEAGSWLRDHTEPNATVVSRKPQFTYLMSGRRSFVYPYDTSQTRVLAAIDSLGATHAYLETFFGQSTKYLYPVIRDHPERFEQIGALGPKDLQVFIFKVKR
jgi:hypothetical protein